MMADFSKFEESIGFHFFNQGLLKQAFTHRSYLNENPSWKLENNERLEFLGDAVLELIVTQYLYENYPKEPEGTLTSYRAALVNSQTLFQMANNLEMNDYLLLSRGEKKDIGKARQFILANTFEAFIGALYLDQGYEATRLFISNVLLPYISEVIKNKLFKDAKSLFQEEAQEQLEITPSYKVLKEWGPDHDKHFTVGAYLNEELIAEGEGSSKQIAQQNAAENALAAKKWGNLHTN
ncbi:MAG: ribonuclease III [Candidatus Niyogibacteria bacterium]|nr:ribonuclease III [Candidatus Niyogibacteria bacterium]